MKLAQLFENKDLEQFIRYDDETKHLRGKTNVWLKNIGASKADVKSAIEKAKDLDSYKAISAYDKTGPLAAVRGSFYFAKPGFGLGPWKDFFIVYANGQIRGTSSDTPYKLKSPKPSIIGDTAVDILVNIYDAAFKQLAKLVTKVYTPENDNDFPNSKEEVVARLKKYNITNYTINDDLTVDVTGDVDLTFKKLKKIPVKFGKIGGSFRIQGNLFLDSLEGCPYHVEGSFNCSRNNLETLEFAPQYVGANYAAMNCKLTSLGKMPREVGGSVDLSGNKLTSLAGCVKDVGLDFSCQNNKLETLEGGPRFVGKQFNSDNNQLMSLKGSPKHIGASFSARNNKLKNLEGIAPYIGGNVLINSNPFDSSVAGKSAAEIKAELENKGIDVEGYINLTY